MSFEDGPGRSTRTVKNPANLKRKKFKSYLELCVPLRGLRQSNVYLVHSISTSRQLMSTSIKKAINRAPFFASTAILEMNFLIRTGCKLLKH